MKLYIKYIILLNGLGCNPAHSFDAIPAAAAAYCDCMQSHNPNQDSIEYWYAKKMCDGVLTEKNYFFRLVEIESRFVPSKLSKTLRDSALLFAHSFDSTLKKNCCQHVRNCNTDGTRPSAPALGW